MLLNHCDCVYRIMCEAIVDAACGAYTVSNNSGKGCGVKHAATVTARLPSQTVSQMRNSLLREDRLEE